MKNSGTSLGILNVEETKKRLLDKTFLNSYKKLEVKL